MTLSEIRVAVMGRFFFYLPLYYAVDRKLRPLLRDTPYADIDIRPVSTHRLITNDADVVRAVSKGSAFPFPFGACDPMELLALPPEERSEFAVVGALVTNSAFWAANHGTHEVRQFSDLAQYGRVVGYKPGSTSHRILTRICGYSDTPDRPLIVSVEKGDELRMLDRAVAGHDALVITPDLPGILQAQRWHSNVRIEMPLARTEEFQHVLTTALITRVDIIAEHRPVVVAMLAALELALREVRGGVGALGAYADEYFVEFKQDGEDLGSQLIAEALELAREHRVFPTTVAIPERDWAAAVSATSGDVDEGHNVSSGELAAATYRLLVRRYESAVDEALQRVTGSGLLPSDAAASLSRPPDVRPTVSLLAGAIATLGVAGFHIGGMLGEWAGLLWAGALLMLGAPVPSVLSGMRGVTLTRGDIRAFTVLWWVFLVSLLLAVVSPPIESLVISTLVYGSIGAVFVASVGVPGRRALMRGIDE